LNDMLERYTERARGAIFLARYEASSRGSSLIEAEHLLLSLLKEDKILLDALPNDIPEVIRSEILQVLQVCDRPASTSVDIPLSRDSKRALAYSAEEAGRLGHKLIDCGHLTLGLLRIEGCLGRDLLRTHGIDSHSYRSIVGSALQAPTSCRVAHPGTVSRAQPMAPWLQNSVATLEETVAKTRKHLKRDADVYGEQPLLKKPWTRKQALGHLVDWAGAHHTWFARALTEVSLVAHGYPQDDWVSAQKYDNYAWQEIVDLWVSLNRLLIHVLAQIPEDKFGIQCCIGSEAPIPSRS
jgi:hypothetical protein